MRRRSRGSAAERPAGREAADVADPYALALQWLSTRELSARQLRDRLTRRQVPPDAIEEALARLRAGGVLDESRMARAAARLETAIRGRGPARTRQRLRALGLSDDDVEQAVTAALEEVDLSTLLDRALDKRLRRERGDLSAPATVRRVVAALVRQGFAPGAVLARLRKRGADVDAG
ncbi:MAG: regulatory protein RecX [Vicinamibacterales bacterium]